MKILDILDEMNTSIDGGLNEDNIFCSFEFFPPKTQEGVENLVLRIERMGKFDPLFVDVTWGAGGSTKDLTLELCKSAINYCGLTCQMHLTCTNMPREEIKVALEAAKEMGIRNICALRGDPPKGSHEWKPVEKGFEYAADLVKYIRDEYGDYFGISVAGFPEGHLEANSYEDDIKHLKAKVDAGADFIITQLFYDVNLFLKFVNDCRDAGILVPIIPGIMAIQNYRGFVRMTSYCKIQVPQQILDDLEPIKHDDEAVKAYGIELGIQMCKVLLENGAPFIHFYTLNLERSVKHIMKGLGGTTVAKRKLPWRPSHAPNRKDEAVRPIYWANRPHSYLARTESWDEFPNGRWGDSRSPAFGELGDGHFYSSDTGPLDVRKAMWGEAPTSFQDIYNVFDGYISNNVVKLPWCEQTLDLETGVIADPLKKINRAGFLTINSQPRINGTPSNHSEFGWGGAGGLVYQKAYLEFFCCPQLLGRFIEIADEFKSLTYHAVDVKGNTYSNCKSTSPSAVTWGVWPNREVQQPTIVDPASFLVWKDEAFRLWLDQWACIYKEESKSYELIYDIHDSFFLVNVVDNNFVNGNIFQIFTKILSEGLEEDSARDFAAESSNL